jgi:hypothetical protein
LTAHAGAAFFNREAAGVPRHLWFVITEPQEGQAVIANVSTKPGPDTPGCRLSPGEHRHISRPSWLRPEMARGVTAAQLELLADSGQILPTVDATPELLAKLRAALLASDHTPLGVKRLLRPSGT